MLQPRLFLRVGLFLRARSLSLLSCLLAAAFWQADQCCATGAAWAAQQPPGSVFSEAKTLAAAEGMPGDKFGNAVSISGDIAAVGVKTADVNGRRNRGAVYIYERHRGGADNWGLVKVLAASDGAAGDGFGVSVAVSGRTVVVGADGDNVGSNVNQGSAYIFERDAGGPNNWGEVKKLVAADGARNDHFGIAVAISGDTIIVSADRADVGANEDQGAVYVFRRDTGGAGNWGEAQKLTAPDGAADDAFGVAVAAGGDVIIVGADHADIGRNSNRGAAYVFARSRAADALSFIRKLLADDGAASDNFGGAVAVSGETVVVGACCHDVGRNTNQGAAYVFERHYPWPDNWGQTQKLIGIGSERSAQFSSAIAIDGNLMAVGAPLDDVEGNADQGVVYIFSRNEGGPGRWGLLRQLSAADGEAGDEFGSVVAVGGETVVVGVPRDDMGGEDRGSARVFTAFPIALLPETLAVGTVGADYFQPLTVAGGVAPYGFAVTSGELPRGLVLNGLRGVISGVPSATGKSVFTLTLTDARGAHAVSAYAVTVICPQIRLSPDKLPDARVVKSYRQMITATFTPASAAPFNFKITNGSLPLGLALDGATGVISGTPKFVGIYRLTIGVTDSYGCAAVRDYVLRVSF